MYMLIARYFARRTEKDQGRVKTEQTGKPSRKNMITTIRKRLLLAVQITILLAQVVGLVIAASTTGLAEEPSTLSATGFDPITDCATEYRDEMRAHAGIAVSKARAEAMTDLDTRLQNKKSSDAQLERDTMGERG